MNPFNKGDRVRLSAEGVERFTDWRRIPKTVGRYKLPYADYLKRLGTVTSQTRRLHVSVLWDGNTAPTTLHPSFVEKV